VQIRKPRVRVIVVAVVALIAAMIAVIPRVSAATEVHITAAGDFGARATTAQVLDKTAELNPDAALALGDLAYEDLSPETAWCDFVKARLGEGFPFELISGNHESLEVNNGSINNFASCLPNQVAGAVGTYGRQYYLDFPKINPLVRVIQVSKDLTFESGKWTYSKDDARYKWLSDAIDSGRAKGAKWTVVTTHIPCLSVGSYGCPTDHALYDMLVSKKVDLVLHGHEHSYMRTKQLRTGTAGCPTLTVGGFDPDCVVDSGNSLVAGAGTVFATVGTGGMDPRALNPSDPEAGYFAKTFGLNQDPTTGLLDLRFTDSTLTAGFVATAGAGKDSFIITQGAPPANQNPVASFTNQISGLSATVDGSGSADADGTISSYSWDFGDGETAAGAKPPAHDFAVAGTYNITLTVTDDKGATNTAVKPVVVTSIPPQNTLAQDSFARTLATGWGPAAIGGTWAVSPAAAFAVTAGQGTISSPLAAGRYASLPGVSSDATDLALTLSVDKVTTGGGLYASITGRSTSAGDYRAKVRFRPDGKPSLGLVRTNAAGVETSLKSETLAGALTYSAGGKVRVRLQVTGSGTTTVRVKIWKAGDPEPAAWLLSATDSTAGLQIPGAIGLFTYLSSTATNAPVTLSVDDLDVIKP